MKTIHKNKKNIPEFKTEEEEREFWATHDSTEFIDWSKSKTITFSKLKPTLKTISLRLPVTLIEELKFLANKNDIPYQSLMKMFLAEKIEEKLHK